MLCWIWRGWSALSSPFRRTNVITLWVWNMHECLEQFKHWRKCKLNDVSWVAQRLSVCNRKYRQQRMSFAFGSAKDQVGLGWWAGATPPGLSRPYETQLIIPHWVHMVGLNTQSEVLECVPSRRQSSFSTVNMSSLTDRALVPFHPCEYYVTMETALKLLWNL